MGKGFANLSKPRRKEIAKAGGKKAHAMGLAHRYTKIESQRAAAKSVERRRKKTIESAARKLMQTGIAPETLHRLNLSYEEYLYYGGSKMNKDRIVKLAQRILDLAGESDVKVTEKTICSD